MKGLEALKDIKDICSGMTTIFDDDLETIEKELKALEIIKEKKMNVELLLLELTMYKDYEEYKDIAYFNNRSLTRKEYDLLKEVLL